MSADNPEHLLPPLRATETEHGPLAGEVVPVEAVLAGAAHRLTAESSSDNPGGYTRNETEAYFGRMGRIDRLPPEEHEKLALVIQQGVEASRRLAATDAPNQQDRQYARDGAEALGILVGANLRLVVSRAKSFIGRQPPTLEWLDLIQAGNVGLTWAALKYNPAAAKFSTYAVPWIDKEIRQAIKTEGWRHGIPADTMGQLLAALGYARGDTEALDDKARRLHSVAQTPSLQEPRGSPDEDDYELQNSMGAASPELEAVTAKVAVDQLLSHPELTARQATALRLRFRIGEDDTGKLRTYEEVGVLLGCSRQHAETIVKKGLQTLREVGGL